MRVYVRLTCGDDAFNVEQSVMHIYFTMVLFVYDELIVVYVCIWSSFFLITSFHRVRTTS